MASSIYITDFYDIVFKNGTVTFYNTRIEFSAYIRLIGNFKSGVVPDSDSEVGSILIYFLSPSSPVPSEPGHAPNQTKGAIWSPVEMMDAVVYTLEQSRDVYMVIDPDNPGRMQVSTTED